MLKAERNIVMIKIDLWIKQGNKIYSEIIRVHIEIFIKSYCNWLSKVFWV